MNSEQPSSEMTNSGGHVDRLRLGGPKSLTEECQEPGSSGCLSHTLNRGGESLHTAKCGGDYIQIDKEAGQWRTADRGNRFSLGRSSLCRGAVLRLEISRGGESSCRHLLYILSTYVHGPERDYCPSVPHREQEGFAIV